jgi:peptidoglycan/LPS O-acetylase OafA/YrhL
MEKKIFIPQLNSLRFFAAVAIVIFHFGKWSWPFNQSLNNYASIMNVAVSFFFVLSGFIMATVYEKLKDFSKENAKKFYIKRAARIVPLYVLALIITSVGYIFLTNNISLKQFLESLFFVQSWIPADALSLNFTGWSLSVEMFFYALFPFVFPFISSRKHVLRDSLIFWLISNAIVLFLCFSLNQDVANINYFTKFFPLFHLNQFLIGIVAGLHYLKGTKKGNLLFLFCLLFLVIYLPFVSKGLISIAHHDGLLAPIFALLIIGAASSERTIKKILSWPLFVKGGDASYGIYILQFPVYVGVYHAYEFFNIYNFLGEEGRFYAFLLILILASYLSSRTFEVWAKKKFV